MIHNNKVEINMKFKNFVIGKGDYKNIVLNKLY